MQYCARNCLYERKANYGYFGMIFIRAVTTNQIQSALRPFFFKVHPDLFGRWPEQRSINENSLQILSAHIESLQVSRMPNSKVSALPFYLRNEDKSMPFRLVKVPLQNQHDIRSFITNILKTCDLETSSIEKAIPPSPKRTPNSSYRPSSNIRYTVNDNDGEYTEEFDLFQFKVRKNKLEDETLENFMRKNIDLAQIRTKSLEELREEVDKLKIVLESRLQLKSIVYNCGWNFEHFHGCLRSLEKLDKLYHDDMINLLNKTIIFSQFTGVSLDGEIHLFTGDVQHNWLDLIKNIPKQQIYLNSIPMYENTLSQVLRNIKIARRKYMPKTLAESYSGHLSRIITTVLDYLGNRNKFPESWPDSLSDFELVVESESGPLMVNPTGQLIVPSTCPGFLLVDFITKNLETAHVKQEAYKRNKYIERDLIEACQKHLGSQSILKDDCVSADLMIDCMRRLLKTELKFPNLNIYITNYYTILSDGTICFPWNFK